MRPLLQLMRMRNVSWIHYLKVDCEGCEPEAIPQFLVEANRSLGHVPVTTLQMEVHPPSHPRLVSCDDRERMHSVRVHVRAPI